MASDVLQPLEKALWAGALDSVGGETLAWLTRTMQQNGAIASFGNAGGIELHTTVLPFILRGIHLIGIDSAATAMPLRRKIWERLAYESHSLKELLQSRHGEFSKEDVPINKLVKRTGPLWQEDYWDRMIRNEAHFYACKRYVVENPINAKLSITEYVLEKGGTGVPPVIG